MPLIQLAISPRSGQRPNSPALAEAVCAPTETILKKRRDLMAVIVTEIPPETWFVGGKSLAEDGRASFWLDIKVTDGTNDRGDVQRYIAEIYRRMGDLLGPLHPESYVLVHEVDGHAYGYGGRTQSERFHAAAPA